MFSSSTTLSVSPLEGFKVGVWDGLNDNATLVGGDTKINYVFQKARSLWVGNMDFLAYGCLLWGPKFDVVIGNATNSVVGVET